MGGISGNDFIHWPNEASRILCYYFSKRQKPKPGSYSVSFPHRMKVGYLYSEGFFTCIIPVPPNRIPVRSDETSLKKRRWVCWVQEYVLVLMMATFLQKTPRGLTLPYQWKWNRLVTWIFKESWVFQCKLLQNRMTTKPHLGIDCSNICIHHRVTEEQFPRAREVQRWACSTCTLRLLLPSTNLWLWLGEESEAAGSLPTREEGYGLCEWITRLATTVEWVRK